MRTVEVTIKNAPQPQTLAVPVGTSLEELYQQLSLHLDYGPTSALVNNDVRGMHHMLCQQAQDVEFLTLRHPSGLRTYTRTLFFVLYKAVRDLYPHAALRIDTPVSGGYYCQLRSGALEVTDQVVADLLERMQQIVDANLPLEPHTCPTPQAVSMFRADGLESKAKLLEGRGELYTEYYTLTEADGHPLADFFYGSLLPSTGLIHLFGLEPYADGLLLRIPDGQCPSRLKLRTRQDKMFEVFREQHTWQQILGVQTVGEFNEACARGHATDLINVSEALQDKRIAGIADQIASRQQASPGAAKVVLIAGPSSSGKTTFSKRLEVQLSVCGLRPVALSLDDYFVDRDKTPRDPKTGEYDFEHLQAMNIPLFNEQMQTLLRGEQVELPRYNFHTGLSERSGRLLRLQPDTVLILEGIHALNPELTALLPPESKFKIYASALTTIMLDDHNYIPTTDNRLLRRIVRDYKYRGYSAQQTISRWPSVRQGEDRWIFPFQEQADAMVNTALLFELAALRSQALPLLEQVPECVPEYSEARRLRKFLRFVSPIGIDALPPTSLLREFLGGSTFQY